MEIKGHRYKRVMGVPPYYIVLNKLHLLLVVTAPDSYAAKRADFVDTFQLRS